MIFVFTKGGKTYGPIVLNHNMRVPCEQADEKEQMDFFSSFVSFPRSAVLRQMFLSPMEEARTGTVEITDMDSKTLKKMLEFVYTGEVDDIEDVAEELLYAADKYEIKGLVSVNHFTKLKQICTKNIC